MISSQEGRRDRQVKPTMVWDSCPNMSQRRRKNRKAKFLSLITYRNLGLTHPRILLRTEPVRLIRAVLGRLFEESPTQSWKRSELCFAVKNKRCYLRF